MGKDCYCSDIERAGQLAARLCLNWKMPLCPFHESKRECCVSIQQDCPKCGYVHVWNPDFSAKPTYQKEKKPDPVESKLKAIWLEYGGTTLDEKHHASVFEEQLRELVALARAKV